MNNLRVLSFFSKFHSDEDGAVTVDWVMLTAGIVLFGILVIGGISTALSDTATYIASEISSAVT